MKALQLVPAMEEGGVERYAVLLNRILVRSGWQNVVVSKGGKLVEAIVRDGGRHVTLDLKSKNPLTYFVRARRLRRLLKAERPDVVCAHSRVPAWLFVWANRGVNARWMTYAHGANSVSRYSRVMVRGERTMCPSSFVADYLKAAYGIADDRLRVVPHAVDGVRFDPAGIDCEIAAHMRRDWRLDGTFVVMSVGRITRLKGYDTLIRAFARLKMSDAKLVIVGGAERGREGYLAELRGLVRELGLGESVVFAGAQTRIPECLSLADVVVSANTAKPEAFGLSMAEALTMGKPVVAKAFGGALDVVRQGVDGLLIPGDHSVEQFADALGRIRGMAFGDLRSDALKRFDFEVMARQTCAVYEEFVK